jgi:hypothetical protein
MKKVITFIMIFALLCLTFGVVAYAEDGSTAASVKTVLDGILDRVFEWWNANKAEILAACSGLGAAFASVVLWLKNKKP